MQPASLFECQSVPNNGCASRALGAFAPPRTDQPQEPRTTATALAGGTTTPGATRHAQIHRQRLYGERPPRVHRRFSANPTFALLRWSQHLEGSLYLSGGWRRNLLYAVVHYRHYAHRKKPLNPDSPPAGRLQPVADMTDIPRVDLSVAVSTSPRTTLRRPNRERCSPTTRENLTRRPWLRVCIRIGRRRGRCEEGPLGWVEILIRRRYRRRCSGGCRCACRRRLLNIVTTSRDQ